MSRYVVLLGAGASAAAGAPIQSEVLARYFEAGRDGGSRPSFVENPARFFKLVYGLDISVATDSGRLPTFEDALGLVDLALERGESLRGIPRHADAGNDFCLHSVRRDLVLLLADAVRIPQSDQVGPHRRLLDNLNTVGRLRDTTFITTNYDVFLDNAIEDFAASGSQLSLNSGIDYGFSDFAVKGWRDERATAIELLKIHGSLNWMYCSNCFDLEITSGPDAIARLLIHPERAACSWCDARREPVIVPPTFYKDLSNVYLTAVRIACMRQLRDCERLVVCGYSMPDADMHVRALLKAAQMNRKRSLPRLQVFLVNSRPGKPDHAIRTELERYSSLFGPELVTDTRTGFVDFAARPEDLVGASSR